MSASVGLSIPSSKRMSIPTSSDSSLEKRKKAKSVKHCVGFHFLWKGRFQDSIFSKPSTRTEFTVSGPKLENRLSAVTVSENHGHSFSSVHIASHFSQFTQVNTPHEIQKQEK